MIGSKFSKSFGLLLIVTLFFPAVAYGQLQQPPPEEIEEVLLELIVERQLIFDYSAILDDGQLYLPSTRLFSILDGRYEFRKEESIFEVRFGRDDQTVALDLDKKTIEGVKSVSNLSDQDFFIYRDELYLRKSLLEELFGLTFIFDHRQLDLKLFSEEELQVIRQHNRRKRYRNFQNEQTFFDPDISRTASRNLFDGWILNWGLNSSHSFESQGFSYAGGVGGELLGGNLSTNFSGSKDYGIHWHDVRGRWEFPVYSSPFLTHFTAGFSAMEDNLTGGTRSFKGIEITNKPLSTRRQFSRFTLSNNLEEGWDADLEVGGRLEDVTLTPENERYDFTVPLTYGSNVFRVNRYDKQGYNHPRKYHIYVPQDLLPANEFEYKLSAGRYENINRDFGKLDLKWGLSPHLTIGGGGQVLSPSANNFSDLNPTEVAPFLQVWSRLGSTVYFRVGHTYKYLSQASMRIIFPESQSLSVDLKKYHSESAFNKLGKSLEASMNSTFPISLSFLDLNTSLSARYSESQSSDATLNLFGGMNTTLPLGFRLSSRVSGRLNNWKNNTFSEFSHLNTRISISKRLLRRLLLKPGITYDHKREKIVRSRFEISGRILGSGNMGLSIDHNHMFDQTSMMLNVSFDLPFGRHSSQVRSNYNRPTFNQRTSGSIAFNGAKELHFDRRSSLNKGAITLDPYLDLNNNSQKNEGEPSVSGLEASVYRKGDQQPSYQGRKTVKHLAAYDHYIVRIDAQSLENPLWSPRYETYEVQPSPNKFTRIQVPIVVHGEVSGQVETEGDIDLRSLSGVEVHIVSLEESFKEVVRTYSGGSFYLVGLKPGDYMATLNSGRLARQSIKAVGDSVSFTIKSKRQGDIVDGLKLRVSSNRTKVETDDNIFVIQVGAFRKKENAERHAALSQIKLNNKVTVIYDNKKHLYKCQIRNLKSEDRANEVLKRIKDKPTTLYEDSFLIKMPGN